VAAALGARVLAVAGSAPRRELAAAAGAHTVYGPDEWFAAVRADGGADVIVDPVGGDVFEQSVRCLAPEGRLLTVGFTSGRIPAAAANRLLLRNAGVLGAAWRELVELDPALFAGTAAALAELVAAGLRPLIGATYQLADGPDALRAIESRAVAGKVVLIAR
jgi:NADPH2:quinone reductase